MQKPVKCNINVDVDNDKSLHIKNVFFCLGDNPILSDSCLNIRLGTLVGIEGAIGIGELSFLAAILGEMNQSDGVMKRNFRIDISRISITKDICWYSSC